MENPLYNDSDQIKKFKTDKLKLLHMIPRYKSGIKKGRPNKPHYMELEKTILWTDSEQELDAIEGKIKFFIENKQ